jgi:hypothetical protein
MSKSHSSASQCRGARASYDAVKSNSGVAARELSKLEEIEIGEETGGEEDLGDERAMLEDGEVLEATEE